jgi:enoyl-CoA hydratase
VTDCLRAERGDDGVVVLTLDVPDRRNAMTGELTEAWRAAVEVLRGDPDVRVVVVTGAGSAFCSGGDLSWIGESPDLSVGALRERMLPFYRTWLGIRSLDVPVLAAVNGAAVGAGLCLALACDLRYASTSARFSAPFARLGMHPGMAATYLLPDVVGPARARDLLLTGRTVDAAEALQIGLVQAVHEPDDLLPAVLDVARQIAASAPLAVRLTTAALAHAGHRTLEEALQWEGLAQPVTMASADLREGLAAQAERRPPRFQGR